MTIVFFGSFLSYSVDVLKALHQHFTVVAVITTAPRPKGRHMELSPTDVSAYAKKTKLLLFELADLSQVPKEIPQSDFIVVSGFGEKIPSVWLEFPKIASINMHPSLIPEYRGAFPAEWAILRGEAKTGVTIIRMSEQLDKGDIVAQKEIAIERDDTRLTLYQKLYKAGADLLVQTLPQIARGDISARQQPPGDYFYARRITREDGFVPWEEFFRGATVDSITLDKKFRAFSGWPGVWTKTPQGKRLKLIALKPKIIVQLEGKNPVPFSQFSSVYVPATPS